LYRSTSTAAWLSLGITREAARDESQEVPKAEKTTLL
jgi:hypothetical protein